MRKIIFILYLLPLHVFAQEAITDSIHFPIDSNTDRYTFTSIEKVDTMSADKLYSRAKLFIAYAFKSYKGATQLTDDAAKNIVIKAEIKHNYRTINFGGDYGYTSFTITIQCKDGRYRYIITDFIHHLVENNHVDVPLEEEKNKWMPKKWWPVIKGDVYKDVTELQTSLVLFMKSSQNDNW